MPGSPCYEAGQKFRDFMHLQTMIGAVARAVAIHHLAQICLGEFVMGKSFRQVDQAGVFIDVLGETTNAFNYFVAFINPLDVFANCFLSRQIEHRCAHVHREVRPRPRLFWCQLWMLRCRFNKQKLSLHDAVGRTSHQHLGRIAKRFVVEIAAVAK